MNLEQFFEELEQVVLPNGLDEVDFDTRCFLTYIWGSIVDIESRVISLFGDQSDEKVRSHVFSCPLFQSIYHDIDACDFGAVSMIFDDFQRIVSEGSCPEPLRQRLDEFFGSINSEFEGEAV
ncbi:MAG: hypothetical protein ABII07_02115 [Patescibacteria group bacterium]|nr:hypothetical protein [Patescibacteria group bacterium]